MVSLIFFYKKLQRRNGSIINEDSWLPFSTHNYRYSYLKTIKIFFKVKSKKKLTNQ